MKMKTLVINLDRAPERMEQTEKNLKAVGLDFVRVSGTDGKIRTFTSREVNRGLHTFVHGRIVMNNEIGCYISHYEALEKFVETGADIGLILEDDMEFAVDFKQVLDDIISKDDWDIVKLYGTHGGGKIRMRKLLGGKYHLVRNAFHQNKSGAYLIKRDAAKRYVAKMLPMFVPHDHEYIKYWKYRVRGRSVFPNIAWERKGVASSINYAEKKKYLVARWKRVGELLYKSYIDARRLLWTILGI
ncbi:MAG: glycosyltransferase family 25 protein [Alphaproteobacteria bacterium]|nr:glycosyltransferase family 25 protein [Alphaproteobacteria bacterium]